MSQEPYLLWYQKKGRIISALDPSELEELVGNICFIANHEENNSELVEQLDELAEYLGE